MNRRPLPVAAVLTATAALLLTACGSGGDDDPKANEEIVGAEQGGERPVSPSASNPAETGGPKIEFPKSFQMDFESWANSDPKLQSILNDGREQLRADHAAIIDGDTQADYLRFYNTGPSLKGSREWVQQYVQENVTLVGEMRVFNAKPHITPEGSGVLFYCLDESGTYAKDRKTGKKTGTPAGDSPRLMYRTTLKKSPDGVWQTVTSETERGGC